MVTPDRKSSAWQTEPETVAPHGPTSPLQFELKVAVSTDQNALWVGSRWCHESPGSRGGNCDGCDGCAAFLLVLLGLLDSFPDVAFAFYSCNKPEYRETSEHLRLSVSSRRLSFATGAL